MRTSGFRQYLESQDKATAVAQHIMDLFPGTTIREKHNAGLLDIYIKQDGSLWVNIGDWSEVGSKQIEQLAGEVPVEVCDECGRPSENRGWTKFYGTPTIGDRMRAEMAGTYAIVGCKDRGHPDFQIWGAMSDLKCGKGKKKKTK